MNLKKVYSTTHPELVESSSECFYSKYTPLSFSNYEVLLKNLDHEIWNKRFSLFAQHQKCH